MTYAPRRTIITLAYNRLHSKSTDREAAWCSTTTLVRNNEGFEWVLQLDKTIRSRLPFLYSTDSVSADHMISSEYMHTFSKSKTIRHAAKRVVSRSELFYYLSVYFVLYSITRQSNISTHTTMHKSLFPMFDYLRMTDIISWRLQSRTNTRKCQSVHTFFAGGNFPKTPTRTERPEK